MPVTFEMRVPPGEKANGLPNDVAVEYVAITTDGKDVVCRRATDAHRERYAEAYAAFKASLLPPVPAPVLVPPPPAEDKKPGLFAKKK